MHTRVMMVTISQSKCQLVYRPLQQNSQRRLQRVSARALNAVLYYVYMIQPVVQPVKQPVAACKRGFKASLELYVICVIMMCHCRDYTTDNAVLSRTGRSQHAGGVSALMNHRPSTSTVRNLRTLSFLPRDAAMLARSWES